MNDAQEEAIGELLAMIRHMVDDDDLSIQEFAKLDLWLAAHPQVADLWPAKAIATGVHMICADDVVDQEELDALCEDLKKIAAKADED